MNDDISIECVKNHIYKYEIAHKLGITDTSFSRKLRKELSDNEKNKIYEIIMNIRKEKNQNERNA